MGNSSLNFIITLKSCYVVDFMKAEKQDPKPNTANCINKEGAPNRRGFLKAVANIGIGAGTAGVFATLIFPKQHDQRAEALAETLKDLPGVGRVDTCHTSGASRQIIHIAQFHEVPNMSVEQIRRVKGSQSDIKRILISLMKHEDIQLRQVFLEGETKETRQAHQDVQDAHQALSNVRDSILSTLKKEKAHIESVLKEHGSFGLAGERLTKRVAELNSEIEKEEQRIGKASKNEETGLCAAEELERRGLKIHYAENLKENVEGAAAMQKPNLSDEDWKDVLIDRERVLLNKLAKDPHNPSFFIYGAGHDFRAAVMEWNTKHPEDTISLIVITPEYHLCPPKP